MRRVLANLQPYMDHDGTWFHKIWAKKPDVPLIAYFSAEFGLIECLSIFAYDVLERDVVPTFYDRGADRIPRKWVDRMKASIGSLCHFVNTHRVVSNYVERYYIPNHEHFRVLADNNAARGRALAAGLQRTRNE